MRAGPPAEMPAGPPTEVPAGPPTGMPTARPFNGVVPVLGDSQQAPSSVQTAQDPGASGSAPVEYHVDFHLWPLYETSSPGV